MINRKLLICGIWCAGMCRNTWLMKYGSFMIVWKGSSIHNCNPHPCHDWRKLVNAQQNPSYAKCLLLLYLSPLFRVYTIIYHVSRVYSIAAFLYLQFVLHAVLFHTWNMFCSFTLVLSEVPNMAVFCSALILCFFRMMLRYCLSDFEMVPFASIISGITFIFTFYICCISVVRYY